MRAKHYGIYVNDESLKQKLDSIDGASAEILKIITDFYNGSLTYENQSITIKEKIEKANLLKLNLQNWQLLKSQNFSFDEAKQIILGNKEVKPAVFIPEKDQKQMLIRDFYCDDCKHYHARTEPFVCKNIVCNCGVRY